MRIVVFIALRQLWDRKLLNSIAMGGVVLGVVALLAIKGIMHGFQEKFYSSILKISPHVTMIDKELRPRRRCSLGSETFRGDARLAREPERSPTSHQASGRDRSRHRADGRGGRGGGSLVGSAVLALGSKEYSVELRGIEPTGKSESRRSINTSSRAATRRSDRASTASSSAPAWPTGSARTWTM